MEKFLEVIKHYLALKKYHEPYRLVWCHLLNKFMVIEFFDYELDKIDQTKFEIVHV